MPICSSSSAVPVACHSFYTPSTRARQEVAVSQSICNEFHHAKSEACDEDLELLNYLSKTGTGHEASVQGSIATCNLGLKNRKSKTRRLQMSKYPVRRLEQRNTEMTQGKCKYSEAQLLKEEGHVGDDDVCFCHSHYSTATHRDGV